MALIYILTGNDKIDDEMKNLDLNYMSTDKYGRHFKQHEGKKPDEETLEGSEDINVLAHGDQHNIAGQDADHFVQRLIDTFSKAKLSNRKILLYACNIAEGGDSLLRRIADKLKDRGVKKVRLIGSVDQTFTMTTGTMRVLEHTNQAEKLSKRVEHERGHDRDKAAEPFLRPTGRGWNGFRLDGDGNVHGMTAEEAGNEVPVF
jgi:hypothetical protein